MATSTDDTRLLTSLRDVREVEEFLHTLMLDLVAQRPKRGEDCLPHVERLNLNVPEALRGLDITWDGGTTPGRAAFADADLGDRDPLSLVRPGDPSALGFTIGCIRIGRRVKVCLECGWLYCKIVIKGTF